MKKLIILIMAVLAVFMLFGCNKSDEVIDNTNDIPEQENVVDTVPDEPVDEKPDGTAEKTEFVFPKGAVLWGVDVGGMNNSKAYDAVSSAVNNYSLELKVNDSTFVFTAADMEMMCVRKTITDYYSALSKGENPDAPQVVKFNTDVIETNVSSRFNKSPQNADVKYDTSNDTFKIVSETYGASIDMDSVLSAAEEAISAMSKSASVQASVTELEPDVLADDTKVKTAVEKANKHIGISLKYTYTPDDGETSTETLSKDTIASFIYVDSNYNVKISSSDINKYVSKMSDKHSDPGEPGQFVTTGGYTINVSVTYAGQPVDTDALYDDIYHCVSNCVSGTRTAPYVAKTEIGDMSFGGSYIEIDMSSQYLWVYKNGTCVVSTPIVTGCAYYGWNTPTGVYSVNNKTQGCYLYGADYQTWVDYWVGFIGNSYGIHDASWRDEFGGDIYLYDGSHGCVNVPSGAAASIYSNVSVGTKVVLYGGATNADPVEQIIEGTTEYTAATDTAAFKLDAAAKYPVADLKYVSDNTSVATVAADGTVTIKGTGTANIKVSVEAAEFYTAAEFTVKITVVSACEEGRHQYGDWTQTKAPTCVEGEEIRKCKICDASETRTVSPVAEHVLGEAYTQVEPTCTEEGISAVDCTVCGNQVGTSAIPATGHSFSPDSPNCANGCATLNPDFIVPDPGGDGGDEGEEGGSESGGDEPSGEGETDVGGEGTEGTESE